MNSRIELGQPIFFIDPDYSIQKCSQRLKRDLENVDESELVGQKCHQLFFQIDEPCRRCPVSRAVALKSAFEQELENEPLQGRAHKRRAVATPIQDANGEVQHLIVDCLGDGISIHPKSKHMHEAPRHTSAPPKQPFNRSVLLDRDFSIMLFNEGVKRSTQQGHVELVGHNLFAVAPYYNRQEIRRRLENFVYHADQMTIEFETDDSIYGGGRTRHIVEKMHGHGHVAAVSLRSVSAEKHQYEEKKYFKEQLKMLSQFAGRMAHDVKNALALIATNADFIVNEAPATDMTGAPNNVAQYADIIQKHVKQIVGIVEHANSLKVHNWETIAESDLTQLLNRVVTITQLSKPFISHDVSLKIRGAVPRILTSEFYLERALTELVKAILLNADEKSSLKIMLSHEQDTDCFLIAFRCRQQTNLFKDLDVKLQHFFVAKKQWDPVLLGLLIAYAAVLIQDGSMQTTLLENGEFQIVLKLPRAPKMQ